MLNKCFKGLDNADGDVEPGVRLDEA